MGGNTQSAERKQKLSFKNEGKMKHFHINKNWDNALQICLRIDIKKKFSDWEKVKTIWKYDKTTNPLVKAGKDN